MISLVDIKKATRKTFSRSGGPGGQHVNKTSTKVLLVFYIQDSSLSPAEKERLLRKFPAGVIQAVNQETRYQARNTDLAFENLERILQESLFVPKKRKRKKPPHLTKMGKIKKMLADKLRKYRERRTSQKW